MHQGAQSEVCRVVLKGSRRCDPGRVFDVICAQREKIVKEDVKEDVLRRFVRDEGGLLRLECGLKDRANFAAR